MSKQSGAHDDTDASFLHRFAVIPPELSVLSDLALDEQNAQLDRFELRENIGPLYDIIRHPNTKTPMTLAIYGDWGSGKTTAMRWLQRLLREWTADQSRDRKGAVPSSNEKIEVSSIWFDPWKYDRKEEVWRGLLAEVIITILRDSSTTLTQVRNAIVKFGRSLGRAFVHVAAGLTLKTPEGSPINAELSLEGLKDILNEADDAPPEKAYLNEFESSMKDWVEKALAGRKGKPHRRLVIFIDDLDRCLPAVALQVLEALKLYLNIPNLLFVVGLDRRVIDELVVKHYERLGLSPDKSARYLAKMFQVEVTLQPKDQQIEAFLGEQLQGVKYWAEMPKSSQDLFRRFALRFAEDNPREVKRVLNSAVLLAAGRMIRLRVDGNLRTLGAVFPFEQGLQEYFLRRVLEQPKHKLTSLLRERLGRRFFDRWSTFVRENPTASRTVVVPTSLYQKPDSRDSPEIPRDTRGPDEPDLSAISETHRQLVSEVFKDARPHELAPLLSDPELADLMQVHFPAEPSLVAPVAIGEAPLLTAPTRQEQHQAIYERIAKRAGVSVEVARAKQLDSTVIEKVRSLQLAGLEIADITPISRLTALRMLTLSRTRVTDLTPLSNLNDLRTLVIDETAVADLTPLASLPALRSISARSTRIADLSPLRDLLTLHGLDLGSTDVVDLHPIVGLTALVGLDLTDTRVMDLGPLSNLIALHTLELSSTPVSDLTPLSALLAMRNLVLRMTNVVDLTPLAAMSLLISLDLAGTKVSDLHALSQLHALNNLNLEGTAVTELTPLAGLENLTELNLNSTLVVNLTPLAEIPMLNAVHLRSTKVADLTPLHGLGNLTGVVLTNTPAARDPNQLAALERARPGIEIVLE